MESTMDRVEHARRLLRKRAGFEKKANKYDDLLDVAKQLLRSGHTKQQILGYGQRYFGRNSNMVSGLSRAVDQAMAATPKLGAPAIDVGKAAAPTTMGSLGKKGKNSTTIPGLEAAKKWWGKNRDPNWRNTRWLNPMGARNKLLTAGAVAGGAKYLFTPNDAEIRIDPIDTPTPAEQEKFKRGGKTQSQGKTQSAGADIPPELLAGAGGAAAGGALGYAVAPKLGISRGVGAVGGAVGGATLSALAAALLANRLKGKA